MEERSDNRYRTEPQAPGQMLAVVAESLYLANLLVAPGIGFLGLLWLWRKHRGAPLLARNHLKQTFFVSLWGVLLIGTLTAAFLALGGLHWAWTWVLVILYFTCVHSLLVLLGMFGLARAMAGKTFRYPLIGPRLDRS
ncbi:MAG: hypothetical protein QM739_04180 [Propionivibrio sp.]